MDGFAVFGTREGVDRIAPLIGGRLPQGGEILFPYVYREVTPAAFHGGLICFGDGR